MDKWTSDDVFKWLQTNINISEQQARIFEDEDVDGSILLDFTEDRLKNDPLCLKTGPRMKIMKCINNFKKASGKFVLFA